MTATCLQALLAPSYPSLSQTEEFEEIEDIVFTGDDWDLIDAHRAQRRCEIVAARTSESLIAPADGRVAAIDDDALTGLGVFELNQAGCGECGFARARK